MLYYFWWICRENLIQITTVSERVKKGPFTFWTSKCVRLINWPCRGWSIWRSVVFPKSLTLCWAAWSWRVGGGSPPGSRMPEHGHGERGYLEDWGQSERHAASQDCSINLTKLLTCGEGWGLFFPRRKYHGGQCRANDCGTRSRVYICYIKLQSFTTNFAWD